MKPVVLLVWTALWLAGFMHCPMEALGLFASDHCCFAPSDAPQNSRGAPSPVCSYDAAARLPSPRVPLVSPAPGPMIPPGAIFSITAKVETAAGPPAPEEPSLELTQSWQFFRRAALAPRAPSLRG